MLLNQDDRDKIRPQDLSYIILNHLHLFNERPEQILLILDKFEKLKDHSIYSHFKFYEKAYHDYYDVHKKFPDIKWLGAALPNLPIKVHDGNYSTSIYEDFLKILEREGVKKLTEKLIIDNISFSNEEINTTIEALTQYQNNNRKDKATAEVVEKLSFPLHIFSEKYSKYIEQEAASKDAPVEFVAASMLAGASILINKKGKVRIKEDWFEPAILWTMLVAKPGIQSKSPCFKIAKKILDEVDEVLHNEFKEKQKQHQLDMELYEISKKSKSPMNMLRMPEPPSRDLGYTSDTTMECLIHLESTNPQGIAIVNDEISHLLRSLNQYKAGGGNDKQYLLSAWSGERHTTTRKGDPYPTTIRPYHNIFGTTQPAEVEELMFKKNSSSTGFEERWLYVLSDHIKPITPSGFCVDTELKKEITESIKELYFMPNRYYSLLPGAKKAFDDYCTNLTRVQLNHITPDLLKTYLEKQKIYTARFALILHCLIDKDDSHISKDTVGNAIELSQFYISCFKKVAKLMETSKDEELKDYIINKMKLKGINKITANELRQINVSKFNNKEFIKDVFLEMQDSNLGYVKEEGRSLSFYLT